jgi:hypothetical protein
MVGCAPGQDQITGLTGRVTMDFDALTLVAKRVGMTMHQYIKANPTIIFEVYYSWVKVTYNEFPNGHCGYELTP